MKKIELNLLNSYGISRLLKRKNIIKNSIFIGSLGVLTAGLLVADQKISDKIKYTMDVPEVASMTSDLGDVEAYIEARNEASDVELAIASIDHVSLTSYMDIQEARYLYDASSSEAKSYVDEEELISLEEEYAQLEASRTSSLEDAQSSGDLDGILDYASYDVQTSGDEELDQLVADYISKVTTSDMSRSEQVKACYDYMVENFDYDSNYNYDYSTSTKSVAWAKAFLRDGYGTCNEWSSAFMYVMRALGYDAKLCYGATAASRGGSTEHYWPEVTIDGETYIFDPQVERDIARKSSQIRYMRYGITGSFAESKYYFSRYED